MTVLIGLNTQDGVYLGSDTRLTLRDEKGNLIRYEDDLLKFFSTNNHHMHCIVAGDAKFASFLLQKIRDSELTGVAYTEFREKIEAFVKAEAGLYPDISKIPGKVVFLFAGNDPSRTKTFNMEQIIKYTVFAQETNRGSRYRLAEGLIDAMANAAFNGKVGNVLESKVPFTGLFALEVDATSHGIETSIRDAEYGELLLYGPKGLRGEHVPLDLMYSIDLRPDIPGRNRLERHKDSAFFTTVYLLQDLKKKNELDTVGGAITFFLVFSKGALFIPQAITQQERRPNGLVIENGNLSSTSVKDGKIHADLTGGAVPLRMIVEYYNGLNKSGTDASL